MLANRLKRNAPFASTYLQVIQRRWGELPHFVFGCFAIATNVLVGSMLVLGGSATVHELTGMHTLAATFLTPISVAVYAVVGGMRSTLLADYSHTVVLVSIILSFSFVVYATSDKIGSPHEMARLLTTAAQIEPVANNAGGSYLTFRSLNGFCFGIVNICGNFGTVFADQSYAQRAIASGPRSTTAFMLGGVAWFAVPMTMATTMGLAARALVHQDADMAVLSADEVGAGLPAPAAAAALMGKPGATAMLILLYLAVTSATAAQLVAVSSIFSYNVVKTLKPDASPRLIFLCSHVAMGAWAVFIAVIGLVWYYVPNMSMGWLYTMMGIVIAPAVIPLGCALSWKKANRWGCTGGAVLGLAVGVLSWMVSTWKYEGSITMVTTSANVPLVIANLLSFGTPAVVLVPVSLLWPEHYSFEATRAINAPEVLASHLPGGLGEVDDSHLSREQELAHEQALPAIAHTPATAALTPPEKAEAGATDADAAQTHKPAVTTASDLEVLDLDRTRAPGDEYVVAAGLDPETLDRDFVWSAKVASVMTFVLLVFIPCMALTKKVWTGAGLAAWVSIMMGWLFVSAFIVILLPVYESRGALGAIVMGILREGRRHKD